MKPLCVDLDGTLVHTDTLVESIVAVARDFGSLLLVPLWLFRGKAVLKANLAKRADMDPSLYPYNQALLGYLRQQKSIGRRLILVTAANQIIADGVNSHLGIFDEVIASTDQLNLKGEKKAQVLVDKYGAGGFTYAGNNEDDLPVWQVAHRAIVVSNSEKLILKVAEIVPLEQRFSAAPSSLRSILAAMRPYQWVKNLLVFVPVITANALDDVDALLNAIITFVAFCAVASGIYVVNDLFDLQADRRHSRKRERPFASGALPLLTGFLMAPLLMAVGLFISTASGVLLILLGYSAASIAYSAFLKHRPLTDVFTLACLYTFRLFAGGVASGYHVSNWLFAFSGFTFLSLAIIKRVGELQAIDTDRSETRVRGYESDDIPILQVIGIAASFASSVVLTLYVQSSNVATAYANPDILWGIVPVILFWQCRLWLATARGHMYDDPIVYAARDWVSQLVLVLLLGIVIAAR